MTRIRTLVTLAALAGAVTASGADGGAPLSETQRELRRLQTERKSQGTPTATDGLKAGMPVLHMPTESPAPPQALSPEKQEREKQLKKENDARKNWLIDGVAKLEKEEGKAAGVTEEGAVVGADGDPEKIDTSDPSYLLKLYDEQKKTDDTKAGERTPRAPQPNAFAPFLQGWMAASPVKDQLLSDFGRLPAGGVSASGIPAATAGGPAGGLGGVSPLDLAAGTPAVTKPNPYLADAGVPLASQPGGSLPMLAAPGGLPSIPPAAENSPPTGSLFRAAAEPAPVERKALPTPPADDRKYFPQLKKF